MFFLSWPCSPRETLPPHHAQKQKPPVLGTPVLQCNVSTFGYFSYCTPKLVLALIVALLPPAALDAVTL